MTPPPPLPPTYICPKCKHAYGEEAFITKTGKRARWCEGCRVEHRQRLINLNEKKLLKSAFKEMAADVVAKEEGYANHPLAKLLALSHIAGAKRAIAIRDGKSWKGKKAWREYYQAKRELETRLIEKATEDERLADLAAGIADEASLAERDNNSDGVS
jgi:hypothetical protein